MNEENDSAVYQARLVEIFQSCDTGNKGFLSVVEFERLCRQLQLQSEKDRLYKQLGLSRTSYHAKVYFDDFKSVLLSLLEEVDPESLAADQPANCIPPGAESSAANTTNKNVNQMPSGQSTAYPPDNSDLHLDLPLDMLKDDDEFCAPNDWSEGNERMSPPSPLKRAYIEDADDMGYGNKHQRISSSPAQVETFEGNGMLTSTPIVGDGGMDSDTGLEQLRHVCSNLGVGRDGYLSQMELGQVCQYIGMDQMDEEELEILFKKLDADHDGYISFGEFVEGLARHAITPRGLETPGRTAPRPHSGRKTRNPLPPAHYDRWSPAVYASGESISLFSSLQPSDNSGMVTMEDVVDFWEQLNVPDGADLLLSLGFEPQSKISLKELSATLSTEWTSQAAESSTLAHAITATYLQELTYLSSWLEQTREESKKLRSDLADALSRNSIMAAEVDEHHAQLEKAHEDHIKALQQDHQEQVRGLQGEVEREREAQASQSLLLKQTSSQLENLHQQVSSLQDKLAQAENEVSTSQRRLSIAQDKESEWEALYKQLQKEVQQQQKQLQPDSPHSVSWEREKQAAEEKAELYAVQNKELKDHNDELLAQVEELQQQITSSSGQQQSNATLQPRSNSLSRIPVRTTASSVSSDTSEWDDDELQSSTEALFFRQHSLSATSTAAADAESEKAPSLSAELKQQQRQRRGERRERERKEIEHGFRVEIAELEDRHDEEKKQLLHNLEREKGKLREEYQGQLSQQLAEQQKELQNAFALEKQDLLQQYESRKNLAELHFQQELQALQDRLSNSSSSSTNKGDPIQDIATNLQARSQLQELERAKAELEKQQEALRTSHQQELEKQQEALRTSHQQELEKQQEALRTSHQQELEKQQEALRTSHQQELEKQQEALRTSHQQELESLREKHEADVAELTATMEERVQACVGNVFEEGAEGLEGKLKEDFERLVQQHLQKDPSTPEYTQSKEELSAAFEQDKLALVQAYETQILTLQEELKALRRDFEAERVAFQQLQSGELAQSIRHELQTARRLRASRIRAKMFPMESISEQEEMGGQVDELRHSWEEERRELMVQNQLLEEELADLKGHLAQERQRSAEAQTLRDTVRRLRGENKEIQCLAEGLKEKMSRLHQQQDLERANYERRIDELQHAKEHALRVQALKNAGSLSHSQEEETTLQKEVLQQVMEEVEAARSDSPMETTQHEDLDQLEGQIQLLHHQLQEARTAKLEFQQLKDECELLRQTNSNLEEMVRVLRQRSKREEAEREREDQDQKQEMWEEKKKLQNLLQRTTDKLLKTSAEMAAGQTQLVREVEHLKQKAGNMVELETFTGLQVSLYESQRHAISLQEALVQRTQLADQMMAETEKERRQEREAWEERKTEMSTLIDAGTERYRSLAAQHKSLRRAATDLATQMKDLYVENADLMKVLQQTEAKLIAAQRRNRKLLKESQACHDAVYGMLQKEKDKQGPIR